MKDLEGQTSEIIIYNTDDGNANVKLYSKDGVIWMNQQQMGELYQTTKSTLSEHIKNILQEGELVENSVVRNFRTTASDGKNYNVTYYALPIIELLFVQLSRCTSLDRLSATKLCYVLL